MLRLISLFYIIIFIVSCGGEVNTIYHNNPISSGNTNTPQLNCVPGVDCNKTTPPAQTEPSNACLPGVECDTSGTNTNTNTNTNTGSTNNDTNSSSSDGNKDCVLLPGQTSC